MISDVVISNQRVHLSFVWRVKYMMETINKGIKNFTRVDTITFVENISYKRLSRYSLHLSNIRQEEKLTVY